MESSVIFSKYTKNDTPPTMIPQAFRQRKSIRRCLNNGNIEPCHEMRQLRKFEIFANEIKKWPISSQFFIN